MTAKTTDFSGLLFYNPSTNGFNPVVSATVLASNTTVNEGDSITFTVVTWNIADNTTLYYRIANLVNLTTDRFINGTSGTVTITNRRATVINGVNANSTTATGTQTFDVIISKDFNGPALSTLTITVNDTSQSAPGSLPISTGIYSEVGGTLSDWALSTTWTIEFWSKCAVASGGAPITIMSQSFDNNGIDLYYIDGKLKFTNGGTILANEPTPGVWTHVALVSDGANLTVYYNGTSVYTGSAVNLNNTTQSLMIGKRGPGNFQYFNGLLTGIRITNTAVYSGTFDPLTVALPPTKIAGTRLLINPIVTPATIVDSSDSAHGVGGISQVSKYYPPSVQLTSGTSLSFSGSGQDVQVTGTRTDWALGDNWTIEWWEKIPVDGDGFRGVMSQDSNQPPYPGIDIYHANGQIQMFNGQWSFTEPTRGVWNHIVIQKNGATVTPYVNGVANSISANPGYGTLSNTSNDLIIGLRSANGTSPGYGQWFKGQIANIRISNQARYYTDTFTPPTVAQFDNYGVAVLVLDGSTNAMLDDVSYSNHTITNNGTTVTLTSLPYSRSFGTQGINPIMQTTFAPPVFPVSVIGWTMTGPGITQTTTITGQSNNQFGQTSIEYTPAFVYAPGTYVFTPP